LEAARVAAEKEAKRAAAKAAGVAGKKTGAAAPPPAAGKVKLPFGAKKAGPGAAVVDEMFSALQSKNALKKAQEAGGSTESAPAPAGDAAAATPAQSD